MNVTLTAYGPPGSGRGLILEACKEKLLEYGITSKLSPHTEYLLCLKVTKASLKRLLKIKISP